MGLYVPFHTVYLMPHGWERRGLQKETRKFEWHKITKALAYKIFNCDFGNDYILYNIYDLPYIQK